MSGRDRRAELPRACRPSMCLLVRLPRGANRQGPYAHGKLYRTDGARSRGVDGRRVML